MSKTQIAIIATELGIFAIAVLAFWVFAGRSDAMGYGVFTYGDSCLLFHLSHRLS